MPRCESCGKTYLSVFGACPVCSASESEKENVAAFDDQSLSPEEQKRAMIKSWIEICVGVPALIALIYAIIYLTGILRGAQ